MDNTLNKGQLIEFIRDRTVEYERMLLISCAWSEPLFREIRPALVNPERSLASSLFLHVYHEPLYRALEHINGMLLDSGKSIPTGQVLAPALLQTTLQMFAEKGDHLSEAEIQPAISAFWQAWPLYCNIHTAQIAANGWKLWFREQRKRQILLTGLSNPRIDVVKQLSDAERIVNESDEDNRMLTLQAALTAVEKPVVRIPTGLPSLDRVLGGGFGRGEGVLVLGASGAGKSVASTQFSFDMSASHKGLLIHTEMDVNDYTKRIISNKCKVPYHLIKDLPNGNIPNVFTTPAQREAYDYLLSDMKTGWRIFGWRDTAGTGLFTRIDDILKKAQDEMGGVDHIHLDWLGGALTRDVANDPQKLRLALRGAADVCAALAQSYNIVSVVYAQAHPENAINKRKVGPELACECKTLHIPMTTAIGISAIRVNNGMDADGHEESSTFQERQYLYLAKSRKSAGGLVPFLRRFDQMRIAPDAL